MGKIKHFFEQSWLLIVASFCFGLLIAVTNAALSARIEQNRINKRNNLAKGLLPDAEDFVPLEVEVEVTSIMGKKELGEIYEAKSEEVRVGWIFNAAGSGFQGKIELVVAVDADFKELAGFDCIASNETPGIGDMVKEDHFRKQFEGAPAEKLKLVSGGDPTKIDSEIVAISGATVSSEAVVEIISHYLVQVKQQLQAKGLIEDGEQ